MKFSCVCRIFNRFFSLTESVKATFNHERVKISRSARCRVERRKILRLNFKLTKTKRAGIQISTRASNESGYLIRCSLPATLPLIESPWKIHNFRLVTLTICFPRDSEWPFVGTAILNEGNYSDFTLGTVETGKISDRYTRLLHSSIVSMVDG